MEILPQNLSPMFKESNAYDTMYNHVPKFLKTVIEDLKKVRESIKNKFLTSEIEEDIKEATKKLYQLSAEIQADKPLTSFTAPGFPHNRQAWNESLQDLSYAMKTQPTWLSAPFLYVHCYVYRRICEIFFASKKMKEFDFFQLQKAAGLTSSLEPMRGIGDHLLNILKDIEENQIETELAKMIQVCLWGNRADLLVSGGAERSKKENPVEKLESLKSMIVSNDVTKITDHLIKAKASKPMGLRIDFILDNAGLELFCDFCLAHFLCATGVAKEIHFYVKNMPWFLSDVTINDFNWVIRALRDQPKGSELRELANTWQRYVDDGIWKVEIDAYWTLPYNYSELKKRDPKLYAKLSAADLLIFKGDLNYRKLTSEKMWDSTTTFQKALRGFHPSPLCSLRTLKTETVVGLAPGLAKKFDGQKKDWMTTGEHAVIQFSSLIS